MSFVSWRTQSERLVPKGRGLVTSIHRAAEKAHSRKPTVANSATYILEGVMNPRRGCQSLAGGRGKRRRQSAAPPKWRAASRNPSLAVEIAMPMRNPAPRPSGAPRAREAPLRLFVLNHFQPHAMSLRFRSWPLSGISSVHVCQFHRLARGLLHSLGQLAHVLSLLLVGCCHMQGEQVSQGVHRRVYLRTLLALRPVVAAPRAALRGGLQGAGVQYGWRRIGRSALRKAQQYAQVVDHLLEHSRV